MRIGKDTLMWGGVACAAIGAWFAWRLRAQQEGILRTLMRRTRDELERTNQRLLAQTLQLQANAQASDAERQQLELRIKQARCELDALQHKLAKAEAELGQLRQTATPKARAAAS